MRDGLSVKCVRVCVYGFGSCLIQIRPKKCRCV